VTGRLAGRRYLRVPEWCALTGERPGTVRRALREGRLRGKLVRGRWRVLASEISKREEVKQ
jgi:hypothetical protein